MKTKQGLIIALIAVIAIGFAGLSLTACDDGNQACTHVWVDGTNLVTATCETAGSVNQICSKCGADGYPRTIDALGHDWYEDEENWVTTKDNTGHWYECSRCDVKGSFAAHTPGAAANCVDTQVCTVCDFELNPVDEDGHQWVADGVGQAPTCFADGWGNLKCELCQETSQGETITKREHNTTGEEANCFNAKVCAWDNCDHVLTPIREHDTSGADATCTTAKVCAWTDCDHVLVTALGHDFTGTWQNSPTQHWKVCTREGCTIESGDGTTVSDKANHTGGTATCTTAKICTVCEQHYGEVDPTAHTWNEDATTWITVFAPTCSATGTAQASCTHNAEHKDTTLRILATAPDNHNWGAWTDSDAATCTEPAKETRTCANNVTHKATRNKEGSTALGHDMEWTPTTTATSAEAEAGECKRTGCDHTDTRLIITSVTLLQTVLSELDANTADTPYTILLNVGSLGLGISNDSVGYTLRINNTKFVNLDLSGSGIIQIGYYAFAGCISLTGIIIPDSVRYIDERAFGGCTNLKSVRLPTNSAFTFIDHQAFMECESLTSITIPDSVTRIGSAGFWGCTDISNIIIPATVDTFGFMVFSGWTASQTIYILGHATQEEADEAWGADWRDYCDAVIIYGSP